MAYKIKYKTEYGIVYECTVDKKPDDKIEALKSMHGNVEIISVTKTK
jgi:hypothetical protein